MKKKVLVMLVGFFSLIVFSISSTILFAQQQEETIVSYDNQVQIICHCTFWGKCKASGSGNNCAQSEAGGNINCQDYNGNC